MVFFQVLVNDVPLPQVLQVRANGSVSDIISTFELIVFNGEGSLTTSVQQNDDVKIYLPDQDGNMVFYLRGFVDSVTKNEKDGHTIVVKGRDYAGRLAQRNANIVYENKSVDFIITDPVFGLIPTRTPEITTANFTPTGVDSLASQQTIVTTAVDSLDTSGKREANSFTPDFSSLGKVSVWAQRVGNPTDDLVCELQTVSGGNPTGIVFSRAVIPASSISTTAGFVDISLAFNGLKLDGTEYAMVFYRSGATDAANFIRLFNSSPTVTGAAGSKHYSFNGTTWSSDNFNLGNRVYSTTKTIINFIKFNQKPVFDCIRELLTAEGLDYVFFVDKNKDFNAHPRLLTPSGKTFTSGAGGNLINIDFNTDSKKVYNSIFVYGGKEFFGNTNTPPNPRTDLFIGNGVTKNFQLAFIPFKNTPSTVVVTVAGVPKIEGVDFVVGYEGAENEQQIVFTTAPASGASISVTYEFFTQVVWNEVDPASIAEFTISEKVISDANILTKKRAREVAKATLFLNANPRAFGRLVTRGVPDLNLGTTIVVNAPNIGITNEEFIVLENVITLTARGYRSELSIASVIIAEFSEVYKEIMQELREVKLRGLDQTAPIIVFQAASETLSLADCITVSSRSIPADVAVYGDSRYGTARYGTQNTNPFTLEVSTC